MGVIRRNQVLGDPEWTRVEAASMPETSGLERVSWAIAHTLEDLVVEVGDLWKLVMWQECLQWEQVVQGAVVADMVELIGHGDLRMWEMGEGVQSLTRTAPTLDLYAQF